MTKKILLLVTFAMLMLFVVSCSCENIEPGHVGLKVHVLGGKAGEIEPVGVGRHFGGANIKFYTFPTFNQSYLWTKSKDEGSPAEEHFTFLVDGLEVEADVGIEYNLDSDMITNLFTTYRKGSEDITQIVLRTAIRDTLMSKGDAYTIDELISEGGVSGLKQDVIESLKSEFDPKGINIIRLSINTLRFPDVVNDSIMAKTTATQQAKAAENALSKAEADKKAAIIRAEQDLEVARLESERNKLMNSTYTSEMLDKLWIDKWDGKLPQTMTGDSSGIILMGK